MLRRSTLLPALVAAAALTGLAALGPGGVTLAPVAAAAAASATGPAAGPAARPATETDAPLSLTIDRLTPSAIPRSGQLRVSGWVTNTSDETWSLINVHTFIGADPITSTADLDFEATRGAEEAVGDRITAPGTFDTIPELAPGAAARYTARISVSLLGADEPGVYWFGVHALGQTSAGRDSVADGRARTFLPLVDRTEKAPPPIATSLVLPIRHQVLYDPDGTLADEAGWSQTLSPGGQLASILDFGIAAGNRPVSYLVDPAVPDAVEHLQEGNLPRSLTTAPADGSESPTESPTPTPDSSTGTSAPQAPVDPATDPSHIGLNWLVRLQQALTGHQVLALPWGDIDVAAAAKRGPDVYADARAKSGTILTVGQVPMTPAISAPSGFLDDTALAMVDPATTVLVSDRAVTRGQAPSVAAYAGRRLVFFSSHADDGGPGPDDPLAPIAMRQRILSEAALRRDEPGRQPLVVVFPPGWSPPDGAAFFDGLDVNWMRLSSLADATPQPGRPLAADRFGYPAWQVNHEVDDEAYTAMSQLTDDANRLQGLLTGNTDLAGRIRDEALGNLSYFAREDEVRTRLATVSTAGWVRAQLGSVTVAAPRRVILSSNTGNFSVTVTNGLDQPVSVRIEATSDPPMRITGPDAVKLAAGRATTVLLQASTDKLGVHNVTIALTDPSGNPLGSTDTLPVRAAQVSQVIWLVMGAAVALLLLAIVLRLVRRIRGPGTGRDDDDDPDDGPGPLPDDDAALATPAPVPALRGDP